MGGPERPRRRRAVLIAALVLVAAGALALWDQLARVKELTAFTDPEENFKYGGLTRGPGIPYYLFAVMPDVFADLMPGEGGWVAFGLVDEGRGHPVGFARQTIGFDALTPNCALCHTGTYRTAPDAPRVVVPGAPARMDLVAFNRFIWAAVEDERFTASTLMPAIEARFELSAVERLSYRYALIPVFRFMGRRQARQFAWESSRPSPGWGRVDAFNILKLVALGLPDDGTLGTSDYQRLWRMRGQEGQLVHFAGVSDSQAQVETMSLFGMNLSTMRARLDTFERVRAYVADLPSPAFPFPVDTALAREGADVFARACASCHEGEGQGRLVPQSEVGTDPEFLAMWTPAYRDALLAVGAPPFVFPNLRPSDGYVSKRLDGIWMRAPYLHNGSVPTLRHLLTPTAERPVTFWRGSDVYDPASMGFVWQEPPGPSALAVPFDTRQRGNSNRGHEYGTDLPEPARRALIEHLKTL